MELFKLFGSIGIKNQEANKAIDETTGKAESASGKIVGTFKKMTGILGTIFAGKAIFDFGKGAVEAAATAKAIQSQFDQVFDGIRDQANSKLNQIANTVGAIPSRIKPAFNQIASFAKVAGMESGQALEFTSRATQAAADSAAFYDKSLEETTETLKSYLKGNFNVADNLGILSTETTRNAKATELFGQKYKDLDGIQQQEVLLRMFEDANKVSGAMGQAARESDGFENVMGNLKQSWEDFKTIIGGPLLQPVVAGLQGATEWLQKAGDWVSQLYAKLQENGAIQSFKGAWDNISSVVGTISDAIGDFVSNLTGIEGKDLTVQNIADAIKSAGDSLKDVTQKVKDFVDKFKEGGPAVDVFKSSVVGLTGAWTAYKVVTGIIKGIETARNIVLGISNGLMIARFVQTGALTAAEGAHAAATVAGTGAMAAFNAVMALNPITIVIVALTALVGALIWFFTQTETGKQIWQDFMDFLTNLWNSIVTNAPLIWQAIVDFFVNLWDGIKAKAEEVWNGLVSWLTETWNNISATATGVFSAVSAFFSGIWQSISDNASSVWNGITSFLSGLWEGIKSKASNIFNSIKETISNVFNGIKDTATSVWNSIKEGISKAIDGAKNAVSKAIEKIKSIMNFKWSLPHLKLPRITISGGFSLMPPRVPSFGLSWHAKGGIMSSPTLFGFDGSNFHAGGEAGDEAILPLNDKTLRPIGQQIADSAGLNRHDTTAFFERIIELLEQLLSKNTDLYIDREKISQIIYDEFGIIARREV